jgi:hypothetical protein
MRPQELRHKPSDGQSLTTSLHQPPPAPWHYGNQELVNRGTDAQAATASEGNELEGMEVLHLVLRQWGSHGEAMGKPRGSHGATMGINEN